MSRLLGLETQYQGLANEDKMVELFNHCIFDLKSKAPSIDTPLHAFLPFAHIDHLHPDAAIAIAAAADGEQITHDLFEGQIGWVPWQRPGFDLGLKLKECLENAKARGVDLKGIILGSHGLFTWGNTSYESYVNTLDVVEKCATYVEKNLSLVFGGEVVDFFHDEELIVAEIGPVLRGMCSSERKMICHFSNADAVMEFVNSADLGRLAAMGTSCPDHFLRTKIAPLVVSMAEVRDKIVLNAKFEEYRLAYQDYYENCKHVDSPAIRDQNPVVILIPGVGMFTFAKDKTTARLASEYYTNAINVMKGAEAISSYTALPRQEAFDIEYWLLEEAKLQRMPKPKTMVGRVALITGSGGGIGKAIARKFLEEGACVVLNDIDGSRLDATHEEFVKIFGKDPVAKTLLDVCDEESINKAYRSAIAAFGGVDIVVNNAGISISKSIMEQSAEEWDRLYTILVKGQFLVSKAGIKVMQEQSFGGDIINIVSKNAVVAGPNNPGYGSAKAAQAHLSRLMAAELGTDKIRVNTVNPDAVIADSNIWAGAWAEGRAKAYNITVEELPAYYAKRTLLNETILPIDIANACYVFVSGLLDKTTGNAINVDGGVAMAFYR